MSKSLRIMGVVGSCLFAFSLNAQITLTDANLVNVGDTLSQAIDTAVVSSITGGPTGGNQTWDFTALQNDESDPLTFEDPAFTPFAGEFPTANLAFLDEDSTWIYIERSSTGIVIAGGAGIEDGDTNVFPFNQTIVSFPSTDGTTFTETNAIGLIFKDSVGGGGPIDSFGLSQGRVVNSEIDAWGSLETPLGTWEVIRQNTEEIQIDTFWIYTLGQWIVAPDSLAQNAGLGGSITADTQFTYRWWSDNPEGVFTIVEFGYDPATGDAEFDASWLLRTPNSVSVDPVPQQQPFRAFPNPASDRVVILHELPMGTPLEIIDLNGRLVRQATLSANNQLDVSDLPAGVYHLRVTDENAGTVHTQKLTIAH